MICVLTNYLLNEILNTQNIENFYKTLTSKHYYCEDDFKLSDIFDVYPSAYANAWLVREYKKRGGGYRVVSKSDEESMFDFLKNKVIELLI